MKLQATSCSNNDLYPDGWSARTLFRMFGRIGLAALSFSVLLGCDSGSGDRTDPPPPSGEDVYGLRVDGGNTYTCATCHALAEPAADGIRRPGHALGGAPSRRTYKNGRVSSFREAVNSCLTEWMGAEPWTAEDRRLAALEKFLGEQPSVGDSVSFEIVPPAADLGGGDADRGRALFNRSCVVCHGMDGAGTEKAPPIAGLALEPEYIARRIRTSGLPSSPVYDGLTGGRMPFWAADRLTDAELRDLTAFVATSSSVDMTPDDMMPPDDMGRTCAQTSPKIGQTAELTTHFHGVRGTAEIVDDCTIVLSDFYFDGSGIDVQIYAGQGGRYAQGFSTSGNLVRRGGYEGETLTLTLPENRTLDQLDGISVWCVAVGVDFGSGMFR